MQSQGSENAEMTPIEASTAVHMEMFIPLVMPEPHEPLVETISRAFPSMNANKMAQMCMYIGQICDLLEIEMQYRIFEGMEEIARFIFSLTRNERGLPTAIEIARNTHWFWPSSLEFRQYYLFCKLAVSNINM